MKLFKLLGLSVFLLAGSAAQADKVYSGIVKALYSDRHSSYCAIDRQDLAHCWGTWDFDAAQPPKDLGPVKFIAVGNNNSCAIRMDNAVICWGEANTVEGDVFLPPQLQYAKSISIQSDQSCGISLDGKAYCWRVHDWGGKDEGHRYDYWVRQLPAQYDDYDEIHVGISGSCLTAKDGRAACWNNSLSQFNLVPPANQVTKISLDDWATGCALLQTGNVSCFGANYDSIYDRADVTEAVPANLGRAKDLALGRVNACAIDEWGIIQCWSFCKSSACFYDGVSTPPKEKAIAIAIGIENGCAIMSDQRISCWSSPL